MAKRVFFSFHYQDVIDFRANVVRKSWVTREREEAGFFDGSLWEQAKKTGDASLKKLINDGLDGTTVTAVLIGSETYARRWVRYELFKSLEWGNKLVGIHINQISCKNGFIKAHGPNPFEYLAVKFSNNGDKVDPWEWDGSRWVPSSDVSGWTLGTPHPHNGGELKQLSIWCKTYCWVDEYGFENFATWIA